jgi:hypothetical protein
MRKAAIVFAIFVGGLVLALLGQQPFNQTQIAGTALVADPCETSAKTYLPISEATASLTTIITGTSAKHTYFCSIFLISATAQNINLISATGTNCGTTVHGSVLGLNTSSAAAANGPNLAANSGFVLGNGENAIASDNTAADNICYSSSSTGQVSGVITYVQQ